MSLAKKVRLFISPHLSEIHHGTLDHQRGASLDDGPDQAPLDPRIVRETVLHLLPATRFDLILTHGPRGEYTRHRRHEECCRAIYDYPPSPGGLATQGELLFRGLRELGVDTHAANFESPQEKEWYYRYLLGNSLAVLTGVASPSRSRRLIAWIESECDALRESGELAVDSTPNLFPYILPEHPDWRPRYDECNRPGDYHNGGVWPFICGFHVAACVAAGRMRLARRKLESRAALVKPWHENEAEWGFNEWIKAQTGKPSGRDWQTWSAAMFYYAATCVELERTALFDEIRSAMPTQ